MHAEIGAKVVSHGRYVAFQMAEVAIPENSVRRYPAAGRGAAAATGGRIDVKRLIVLRSIKTKGEVRLDDNEIRISGARRADVTGVGAWEPSCRGFGIAKILKKRQLHPRQGCHPVDVGLQNYHPAKPARSPITTDGRSLPAAKPEEFAVGR